MSEREKLEKELLRSVKGKERNFGKVIFQIKRAFDIWACNHMKEDGYPNMKISYMPFLMNIGIDGITNNELAAKFDITKQAVSKTLKELEVLNLIQLKPNPGDARSSLVFLTNYGMKMVIYTRKEVDKLSKQYIKVLGQKKYDDMIDSLKMLVDIHQSIK